MTQRFSFSQKCTIKSRGKKSIVTAKDRPFAELNIANHPYLRKEEKKNKQTNFNNNVIIFKAQTWGKTVDRKQGLRGTIKPNYYGFIGPAKR